MTARTIADATAHLLAQYRTQPGDLAAVDADLAEDGRTVIVLAETTGGQVLASGFDVQPGERFRAREVEERVELALHFARALA